MNVMLNDGENMSKDEEWKQNQSNATLKVLSTSLSKKPRQKLPKRPRPEIYLYAATIQRLIEITILPKSIIELVVEFLPTCNKCLKCHELIDIYCDFNVIKCAWKHPRKQRHWGYREDTCDEYGHLKCFKRCKDPDHDEEWLSKSELFCEYHIQTCEYCEDGGNDTHDMCQLCYESHTLDCGNDRCDNTMCIESSLVNCEVCGEAFCSDKCLGRHKC